jgi:hypothetical protein
MRSLFRSILPIGVLTLTFLTSVASSTLAWAQRVDKEEPAGKSYTLGYALVVLGIGLGLMLVLRPSGRSTDFKLPKSD